MTLNDDVVEIYSANYDGLDFDKKVLFVHYCDTLNSILVIALYLISDFKDSFSFIEPILLEYSYDKNDYRIMRATINSLNRQIKSFEKNVFPSINYIQDDNYSEFMKYSQKILSISNRIRKQIMSIIKRLSNTDNPDIKEMINSLFKKCSTLNFNIRYLTIRCRKVKKIFAHCKDLGYIIQKWHITCCLNNENNNQNSGLVIESEDYFGNHDKSHFPEELKSKINSFLSSVKEENLSKTEMDEKYDELINCMQNYIIENETIFASVLVDLYHQVSATFLDYDTREIDLKSYITLAKQIMLVYTNPECFEEIEDYYSVKKNFLMISKNIINSNEAFSFLKTFIISINTILWRIERIYTAVSKLKKVYKEYLKNDSMTSNGFVNDDNDNLIDDTFSYFRGI